MEKPQTLQSLTDHAYGVQWGVAVENLDGQAYISIVHLATADSGERVLEIIRKQLCLTPFANLVGSWTSSICTKTIVGTARVHKVVMTTNHPASLAPTNGVATDPRIRPRRTDLFPSEP